MFKHLFKEFPAFGERIGDTNVIAIHVIGGILISITFIFIGLLCLYPKIKDPRMTRMRLLMTKMFGFFLISCGMSRILDTLALWHNYAYITGYIKILTGLLALIAIAYIPAVVKEILTNEALIKVDKQLTETSQRLEEVQNISEKLDKNAGGK